jgi:hypothetical protein
MPATPSSKKTKTPANKYNATAWGDRFEDLEVPSGQLCQVRRTSPQGLIAAGIIDSLDSLTGIVSQDVLARAQKGGKMEKTDVEKVLREPGAFAALMTQVDEVVLYTVVQPPLAKETDEAAIEGGAVAISQVDVVDKMFIFQFALGGTKDFESFRQESADFVGDLDNGQITGAKS